MRFKPSSTYWAIPLLLAALLAGCGKAGQVSGREQSAGGGPLQTLAPVEREGAISVTTRNTTRVGGATPAVDAAAVARVVYPGITIASRPKVVVLVDQRDWPAALAASALAGAPLHAPILFTEGDTLPQVSLQALEAMHPTGATALHGTQVIRLGSKAPVPAQYTVESLPATGPAEAAAQVERQLASLRRAAAPPAQAIVLRSDGPRALQMPAAGLAAESGSPLLFADGATLPAATVTALTALHRPSIYVLGADTIPRPVLGAIARLGKVVKLPGGGSAAATSPQAASIEIARFTDGSFGWGVKEPGHGLVFANSARPLDAPAAALLSATGEYGPLLLLERPGELGQALSLYLTDIQPAYSTAPEFQPVRGVYNHGWLVGDAQAISLLSQAQIDSQLEISPRKQSAGEAAVLQAE